jgi:glycosyl transferase family 1
MKLLIVHPGASTSTADVADGLYDGLASLGVDLVRYRLDQRISRSHRWLHYNWRRTKKTHPELSRPTTADIFFQAGADALIMALWHQVDCVVVVSAMFLHPDVLVLMRRAGVRVVVLFTESPYDQEKEIAVAKLVDGCWTNERSSVDGFSAVNMRSGYLPHGWHPDRHRPGPQPGDDAMLAHEVVFVGTGFHERIAWLTAIDWTGIDLGLYGNWQHLGSRHPLRQFVREGEIDNVKVAALYRRAKIGLNLYRTSVGWSKQAPSIARAESLNPRAYELARCGAFTISTARAEVSEVFGDLVPTFETPAEASVLIRRWLNDPDGRAAIQAQLPGRVAECSWTQRARLIAGDLSALLQARAA